MRYTIAHISTFILLIFIQPLYGQYIDPEELKEIGEEKRDIQKLCRYNQDNVDMLSKDGSFLMVKKEEYGVASNGFRLYKFTANGDIDKNFSQNEAEATNLPKAIYIASDIAEDEAGNIYIAGLKERTAIGAFAKTIVVKYFANGMLDTTFTNGGNKCFEMDFNVVWGYKGPKIVIDKNNDVLISNPTIIISNTETMISLIRIIGNGRGFRHGYFDKSQSFGQYYITQYKGGLSPEHIRLSDNEKLFITGQYRISKIFTDKRKGFLARYNNDLQLDKSFGDGGVQIVDADRTKHTIINDVVQLPDSKILVLGTISNNEENKENKDTARIFLLRLNQNGLTDLSFGNKGYSFFEEDYNDYGEQLEVLKDGNIIAAYHSSGGKDREFFHKFFVFFDKDGHKLETPFTGLSKYQAYVIYNFPFKSILHQMANAYNKN